MNNICSAGTTTSNMMGPINMPPTTTVASGRCTWLPIPVEIADGNRPMQADSAIIKIGRICCSTALNIASIFGMPVAATRLYPLIISMPLITDTPNREIKPMAAEILKSKPAT